MFARFNRLAETVPASPKPEPRAKKQPARGPRAENSALHSTPQMLTKGSTGSDGIPLSLMVGLREVVAQQEGYRTAFFRFAPRWAADTYREHRRETCVVESLRMRY